MALTRLASIQPQKPYSLHVSQKTIDPISRIENRSAGCGGKSGGRSRYSEMAGNWDWER